MLKLMLRKPLCLELQSLMPRNNQAQLSKRVFLSQLPSPCRIIVCNSHSYNGPVTSSSATSTPSPPHVPVMLSEVVSYLNAKPGQVVLDMTLGAGGHSRALLQSTPNLRVFGLDRDPSAVSTHGTQLQAEFPFQFVPILGRFSEVKDLLLKNHGVTEVDGILFDLGVSSMQFDTPSRGFAISSNGPLDMRMDGNRFPSAATAADVLEHIEEEDLARVLKVYGEEKQGKKIARALIEARYLFKSLRTTGELGKLISSVVENESRLDGLGRPTHVATKTFQALRIFVNNELNELNRGLELAHELLGQGGSLVALSFHSLEDRIVKRHLSGINLDDPVSQSLSSKFRNATHSVSAEEVGQIYNQKWTVLTKHVVVPSCTDIQQNPRARSAKLRCALANK